MKEDESIVIDVAKVLRDRLPGLSRFIPRSVIKWLERTICQDEMNRLLEEHRGKRGAEFCHGILESLDITITDRFADCLPPKDNRRVVFVSNHPLGGLDGMALIDYIQRYYGGQVWFIVNDLLKAVKPLNNVFLPINKFGKQSRKSFDNIDKAFAGNDPIIIFPAGLVSRYRNVMFKGQPTKMVMDLEWQKMFVNKCHKYNRDIIPTFFSGQNSMHFYKVANLRRKFGIKFNIEMIYLPQEMFRSRGSEFTISFGNVIHWEEITPGKNAKGFASALRSYIYMLSDSSSEPSAFAISDNNDAASARNIVGEI